MFGVAWPLIQSTHLRRIEAEMDELERQHDFTEQIFERLHTENGMVPLCDTQAAAIDLPDFEAWCECHTDKVCADHPKTEEARRFKTQIFMKVKSLKHSAAGMEQCDFVHLQFEEETAQFTFAYTAVACKKAGQVHIVTAGYGQMWSSASGYALDPHYWSSRLDDVRGYARFGSMKELMQKIRLQVTEPSGNEAIEVLAAPCSHTSSCNVEGLTEVLAIATLNAQNQEDIFRWCSEHEAAKLEELVEHLEAIAEFAEIGALPQQRFSQALMDACAKEASSAAPQPSMKKSRSRRRFHHLHHGHQRHHGGRQSRHSDGS